MSENRYTRRSFAKHSALAAAAMAFINCNPYERPAFAMGF